MPRKKKIRIIQLSLFVLGVILFMMMYINSGKNSKIEIIPKKKQEEVKKQLDSSDDLQGDVFYNIEYSGFDLSGNRYILKAKEASNDKSNQNIIEMKQVEAFFYFKDDTILRIFSEKGVYNNKSLDMIFTVNVNAEYEGSKLFAQRAEYSNSKNFLEISEKVRLKDSRGAFTADKLYFDIEKETLNIASNENNKINLDIDIKWKKVLEF